MTDEATGLQYKLAPGSQDLVEGVNTMFQSSMSICGHLLHCMVLPTLTSPIWKTGMKTFVSGMKL